MTKQSVRLVMGVIVAVGSVSATLGAQAPTKRVRSQEQIPLRKEAPAVPVAKVREVKGKNLEIVPPPVVTTVVSTVPGTNTVISQAAPGIGARPVPWLPLLGLLGGGAVLLSSRDHGSTVEETTTPPSVPATPPVVAPVVPPVTPVPEPMTATLFATGLAGLALVTRRKRIA